MKSYTLVLLVLMSSFVLSCDVFRKLAGRPTSGDLEQKRLEILVAEQEQKQILIDSLDKRRDIILDSLEVLDSVLKENATIHTTSLLGGLYSTELDSSYYVIIGTFKNQSNAMSLIDKASSQGYLPVLIRFKNGYNAVGVSASDSLTDALLSMKSVYREEFCPKDVWILLNK